MAAESSNRDAVKSTGIARTVSHRPPGPRAAIEEDVFYELLTNARRRATIDYLLSVDDAVSVSDLVDHVASTETDAGPDPQLRKSIYVSLRQTHLPRLADHDVVDFDAERNRVEPAPSIGVFDAPGGGTRSGSPWTVVVLGLLAIGWLAGGVFGIFDLLTERVLLVALGYVVLIVAAGLWDIHQSRAAAPYPESSGR